MSQYSAYQFVHSEVIDRSCIHTEVEIYIQYRVRMGDIAQYMSPYKIYPSNPSTPNTFFSTG